MEAQVAPISAPNARLDVLLDLVVDGRPVHIEAKVAGEGEAAQHAVEVISRAIAGVVSRSATMPPPAMQSVAAAQAIAAPQPVAAPAPAQPPSAMLVWVQHQRARINVGFGVVLVALAALIPMIVPPAQRSDVLVLTLLFTLAGALLVFTAFLPGKSKAVAPVMAPPQPIPSAVDAPHTTASSNAGSAANAARRAQLLNPAPRHAALKSSIGIAFSLVFIVAGLVAPFLLGATNADERFLIMLGFVPISVVGFFMLAIFGRQSFSKLLPAGSAAAPAPAKAAHAPAPRRAPVNRVPQTVEYRALVPVVIAGALVLMLVVMAVVVYATLASVAR